MTAAKTIERRKERREEEEGVFCMLRARVVREIDPRTQWANLLRRTMRFARPL